MQTTLPFVEPAPPAPQPEVAVDLPVEAVDWHPDKFRRPAEVERDLAHLLETAAPVIRDAHLRDTAAEVRDVRRRVTALLARTLVLRDLRGLTDRDCKLVARALPRFVALDKVRALRRTSLYPNMKNCDVYADLCRQSLPWVDEHRDATKAERTRVFERMTHRTADAESDSFLRAWLGRNLEERAQQACRQAGYRQADYPGSVIDLDDLEPGRFVTQAQVRVSGVRREADLAVRLSADEVGVFESKYATDLPNSRRRVTEMHQAHSAWRDMPGVRFVALLDGAFDPIRVIDAHKDGVPLLMATELRGLVSYLASSRS